MDIQSLSVVVPNKECMNKCPFCVSRMVNSNIYPNLMDVNHPTYDYNIKEYMRRMKYVADNGCQTLMLTGTSEPQQNKQFLNTFALVHRLLGKPFTNIEMQTTGVLLDKNPDYLRFLKNFVGVNTMAISLNALSPEMNSHIIGNDVNVVKLCKRLCDYGFNIRICCNLTGMFDIDNNNITNWFRFIKEYLYADQVTFRQMYASEELTDQSKWIKEHPFDEEKKQELANFLKSHVLAGETIYGSAIYHINGMSVIFDNDCMGKKPKKDNTVKYLILRPNCKLYSSWDDPASLVF